MFSPMFAAIRRLTYALFQLPHVWKGEWSQHLTRAGVTSQSADLKKCKRAFLKFGAREGSKGWTFLTAGQFSDRIETQRENTPEGEFCITIGDNHQAFWMDVRLDRACFWGFYLQCESAEAHTLHVFIIFKRTHFVT